MFRLVILASICIASSCSDDAGPMGTPSEDVTFSDGGLQRCYERLSDTAEWREFAEEIEFLRCSGYAIEDLAGIEVLTGLEQLEIWFNPGLGDLSPLTQLSNIEILYLNECGLENEDIAPIAMLESLRQLQIFWNNLGDVSALARLTKLEDLALDASGVTGGIVALSALEEAKLITLAGNPALKCNDIEALQNALPDTEITPQELIAGDNCTR